VLSAAT
jgi:hypothetical protein